MKIIAVMPVRNEEWIIERTLRALSCFCDAIIVADQNSTDKTPAILRSYSKVHVIENKESFHSNVVRWKLLEAARQFDGCNLILAFDADEIPASTILAQNNLEMMANLPIGWSVELPWVQLWRNPDQYRNDRSVWSNSWKHFAFKDDRQMKYVKQIVINDHTARIPSDPLKHSCRMPDIPVLHFQFVVFERMLAKQRWYRVIEHIAAARPPVDINATYIITRDERNIVLRGTPPEWIQGWKDLGIDLEHFQTEDLFWYDIEILRFFAQHGTRHFADLDIWDVDWERKRQFALAQGYDGLPKQPIRDPRSLEQRLYHAYLHRYISTPPWRRDPLGPGRAVARRLGLKRAHLERLGLYKPRQGVKDL